MLKWSEVKVTQSSCLTLWDPRHCSLPRSSVHVIFQARILEWVAISSSKGSSWPRIKPVSPVLAGGFFTNWATWEASTGDYRKSKYGERTWINRCLESFIYLTVCVHVLKLFASLRNIHSAQELLEQRAAFCSLPGPWDNTWRLCESLSSVGSNTVGTQIFKSICL